LPDMEGDAPFVGRLELSSLKIERSAFEVRYPNAYRLWDRSGTIWHRATGVWPPLELVNAVPNQTLFRIGRDSELVVELGAARVIQHLPQFPLTAFSEIAERLLGLAREELDLKILSRVGLRIFLFREYPDQQAAAKAVSDTRLVRAPAGRIFGAQGPPVGLDCTLRWEGDATGVRVALMQQTREYKLDSPPEFDLAPPQHVKRVGVSVDFDFYTIKPIEIGQLRVSEWIADRVHLLRRDADTFLGGTR
jgi:hypothetical protein